MKKHPRQSLSFRQEQLQRQITAALDLLQGSLHKNPSQRGYHLTIKVNQKTVTKYVRKELVPQVRAQLSFVIEGVLSQSLLAKAGGPGRVLAPEIMVPNPAIRNLIREDKVHQIYSSMQVGQAKFGMQTFNQSLANLLSRRLITQEEAFGRSSDPDELKNILSSGVGANLPGHQAGRPDCPGRDAECLHMVFVHGYMRRHALRARGSP